jgi:hypothetical protein
MPPTPRSEKRQVIQYVPAELMQRVEPQGVLAPERSAERSYIAWNPEDKGTWYVEGAAPEAGGAMTGKARSSAAVIQEAIPRMGSTGIQAGSSDDILSRLTRMMEARARIEGGATSAANPIAPTATDRAVQLELLRRGRNGEIGKLAQMRIGR